MRPLLDFILEENSKVKAGVPDVDLLRLGITLQKRMREASCLNISDPDYQAYQLEIEDTSAFFRMLFGEGWQEWQSHRFAEKLATLKLLGIS